MVRISEYEQCPECRQQSAYKSPDGKILTCYDCRCEFIINAASMNSLTEIKCPDCYNKFIISSNLVSSHLYCPICRCLMSGSF